MKRHVTTQAEVAKVFGVRSEQVSRWKKAGCPALKASPFDIEKIREWRDETLDISKDRNRRSDEVLDVIDRQALADARYRELQAENLEFHLSIDRGELMYAADREKLLVKQAQVFRLELLNITNQWADKILDMNTVEQARAVLDKISGEILQRLFKGEK